MSTVLRKLQREVFVLSLAHELSTVPELDGFEARLRGDCELEVEKGPGRDINDLFEQLNARDIKVISLRNKANRLEELFMRLVENKRAASGGAE
jgi:ABC-2 type transport system ATP-binding protein